MVLDYLQETARRKTDEEKVLLRNIHALEEMAQEETDSEKISGLETQLRELKGQLARVSGGPSYAELKFENSELKKKISSPLEPEKKDPEKDGALLLELYRLLVEKHSDLINESEQKTVGEIKSLVNRDDLTIQGIVKGFMHENYSFESHYAQAAEKAFEFAKKEIRFVKADMGIYYWLLPKDMISKKLGDDEDKAVFLCSLLYALGDGSAEVVISEMDNASSHAFVITEFMGKFLLLDSCQGHSFRDFLGEKVEVLENYSFGGAKIKRFMYKFNHSNYEQFES